MPRAAIDILKYRKKIVNLNENPSRGDMSRVEQMIGTQLGGYSIEFLVIGILSYLISKKLRDNLINEYSQKMRIENIQTKLILDIADFI